MITNLQIGSYGRLGNQLYQFAASFNLAKKLNTELWLSAESETSKTIGRYNPVINKYDTYSNDIFKLFDFSFTKKMPKLEIEKQIKHYYKENPRVCFYPEVFELNDNTNLNGYFQGKEYVDLYESDLRNELKLKSYYFDYASNYISELKKSYNNIFSLHVRRGDSLPDNNSIYAELSLENYYKKIIKEQVSENDVILIFSDDLDWCKNNFEDNRIIFIDNRKDEDGHLKDFSLMSMCDVNIMSVSTYSWWTCWMNPLNKDKKIFMPNKWWGWSVSNFCEEIYRYDKWIKYDNK